MEYTPPHFGRFRSFESWIVRQSSTPLHYKLSSELKHHVCHGDPTWLPSNNGARPDRIFPRNAKTALAHERDTWFRPDATVCRLTNTEPILNRGGPSRELLWVELERIRLNLICSISPDNLGRFQLRPAKNWVIFYDWPQNRPDYPPVAWT